MRLGTTILAGILGTTVMTAFSYAVAALKKDNFKEPELLNLLIQKQPDAKKANPNFFAGWVLHYTMGAIWAGVYKAGLNTLNQKPTNNDAFIFGAFGGSVGILIWKLLFKQHAQPPQISYNQFYRQLFLAHFLFALATSKALAYLHEQESRKNIDG